MRLRRNGSAASPRRRRGFERWTSTLRHPAMRYAGTVHVRAVRSMQPGANRSHVCQRLGLAEAPLWTFDHYGLEKLRGLALVLNT